MAHKRKSLDEPKKGQSMRPDQIRVKKEAHYKILSKQNEQLNHEIKTELTHQAQLNKEKNMLGDIRKLMKGLIEIDADPTLPHYVYRMFKGNYVLPLTIKQANEMLMGEQKELLERIQVQEVQMRKAIERQAEMRELIRHQYGELEKALKRMA